MSTPMSDVDLIGYCEIHCTTERALFVGEHINRMIELAGSPPPYVACVPADGWYSVHEEMAELCALARARIAV